VYPDIGGAGDDETGVFVHAIRAGTGWRVDCWGDWGLWGPNWSHQETLYPALIAAATAAEPTFPDTWRHAPVQLEVCGVMQTWADLGWTAAAPDGEVYKSFQWALEQHASVLNAKSSPVPEQYLEAVNDLLRHNGYRLALESLTHPARLTRGSSATFVSSWSNLGVAPPYRPRILTWQLRGADKTASFASQADITTWLPGSRQVVDILDIPSDLPAGDYQVAVALVDRAGTAPVTRPLAPLALAIAGRGEDGWYVVSQVVVE